MLSQARSRSKGPLSDQVADAPYPRGQCRSWVEPCRSISVPRMAGIGAEPPPAVRLKTLLGRPVFGVERPLEVPRLGHPGQLRINGLVAPGSEGRCLLNPLQKIGKAKPGRHDQSRLIYHVGPGPHCLPSECGSFNEVEPLGLYLYHDKTPCLECGQVPFLVLNAFLEDQDRRGVALGDFHLIGQTSEVEIGCVSTAEVVDQITGREQQLSVEKLHR